jgi:hypothetical protein
MAPRSEDCSDYCNADCRGEGSTRGGDRGSGEASACRLVVLVMVTALKTERQSMC